MGKLDETNKMIDILVEMENPFSTRVSGCSKDGWEHGVKNSRFLINEKINKLKGE